MALHDIREVRIPIELDKPRTLLFDLNAFAELEDKFGSLDQAFQKMQQGSVKATRTLLWAGLLHEDENLTERQVGAMISLTNVESIMEQITEALRILNSDKHVKSILINIFGGIMRCDVVAQGIVDAVREMKLDLPLVVRLEGTNVAKGKEILKNSGLNIIPASDLGDAAKKAVASVKH